MEICRRRELRLICARQNAIIRYDVKQPVQPQTSRGQPSLHRNNVPSSFHVLSKYGASGPYEAENGNQPLPGTVLIQLRFSFGLVWAKSRSRWTESALTSGLV